jgi:hypothetical protein
LVLLVLLGLSVSTAGRRWIGVRRTRAESEGGEAERRADRGVGRHLLQVHRATPLGSMRFHEPGGTNDSPADHLVLVSLLAALPSH